MPLSLGYKYRTSHSLEPHNTEEPLRENKESSVLAVVDSQMETGGRFLLVVALIAAIFSGSNAQVTTRNIRDQLYLVISPTRTVVPP